MKTLSFLQPWADAVLYLQKRDENRTRITNYRGPVVMHISKGWDTWGENFIKENWNFRLALTLVAPLALADFLDRAKTRRGGFAGMFTISDCRRYDHKLDGENGWAFGPYLYKLQDVKAFEEGQSWCPVCQEWGHSIPDCPEFQDDQADELVEFHETLAFDSSSAQRGN
jgi:hypothetical protein